ncbi:MAG TPA: PAS domain-containing protein [Rhizomicrobium sp.]|jgi:hypothetical protein
MLALIQDDIAADAGESLRESMRPLAEPRHRGAQLLLNIWREREAAGGFTIGRDIPSRSVARIMHNLMVYEPVEKDGAVADLRVRVAGDTLRFRFGCSPAGKRMSQIFSREEFESHIETLREVIAAGTPIVLNSEMSRGLVIEQRLEVVLLPVWNAQHTERWVLVGIFYFD